MRGVKPITAEHSPGAKGVFSAMAEITRKLAVNIRGQFFFVITTTASTRWLAQNFELICFSKRVNATSQYNDSGSPRCSKWPDGWSGETLLAPCTRKKRLQRKLTKDYHYWIGVQGNIGMFSKS